MNDVLAVALIQSPHGLKGECKVRSLSGEWDHLFALKGRVVTLRREGAILQKTLEDIRVLEPHVLVKFSGIASPEAARTLTGMELVVSRSDAAPLGPGEFYIADLQGCAVVCQDTTVGSIRSVWDSGAHTMLEVLLTEGRTVHVPFMDRYVGAVDLEARRVEIATPWILE